MLVESLHCSEVALWPSTMATLRDLITELPDLITSHLDDVVPRLLYLATYRADMVGVEKRTLRSSLGMIQLFLQIKTITSILRLPSNIRQPIRKPLLYMYHQYKIFLHFKTTFNLRPHHPG